MHGDGQHDQLPLMRALNFTVRALALVLAGMVAVKWVLIVLASAQ
jgi:hypothetical protein